MRRDDQTRDFPTASHSAGMTMFRRVGEPFFQKLCRANDMSSLAVGRPGDLCEGSNIPAWPVLFEPSIWTARRSIQRRRLFVLGTSCLEIHPSPPPLSRRRRPEFISSLMTMIAFRQVFLLGKTHTAWKLRPWVEEKAQIPDAVELFVQLGKCRSRVAMTAGALCGVEP